MIPKILLLDTIAREGVEIIENFASVTDGRSYSYEEIFYAIEDFDGIVIKSGNLINRELLEKAKNLKVIGRAGTGLDNIDMDTAREKGIEVITAPHGNVCSVAEYILCMMLFLSHRFHEAHEGALNNDFRRANWQGRNLKELNVGLIGLGRIGRGVIEKIEPLCRNVYGFDPYFSEFESIRERNITLFDNLPSMLEKCDIISLQLPLTGETKHLLDASIFSVMRKGTIIINASRGAIIDDNALMAAINNGTIAYAALDAIFPEPPYNRIPQQCTYSHYWVHHPRIYYTPHIAGGTKDALKQVACEMATKMKEAFSKLCRVEV